MSSFNSNATPNPLQRHKYGATRSDEAARIAKKIKGDSKKMIEAHPTLWNSFTVNVKDHKTLAGATAIIAGGVVLMAGGIGGEVFKLASEQFTDKLFDAGTIKSTIGIALASGSIGLEALSGVKNKALERLYRKSPSFQAKIDAKIESIINDGVRENNSKGISTNQASDLPGDTLKSLHKLTAKLNGKPLLSTTLGSLINSKLHVILDGKKSMDQSTSIARGVLSR